MGYCTQITCVLFAPERFPLFRVDGDRLYKHVRIDTPIEPEWDWREIPLQEFCREILRNCHDTALAGHGGFEKTRARVLQQYWWPKFGSDICRYVSRCSVCRAVKPDNQKLGGLLALGDVPDRPWQKVAVDLFGPLPRTTQGYVFMLVVSDVFTKFVRLIPLRNATAAIVCKALEEQIFLWNDYGITVRFNPHYYPQSNQAERVNRNLKTTLRAVLLSRKDPDHRHWDKDLAKVACALNTARCEASRSCIG